MRLPGFVVCIGLAAAIVLSGAATAAEAVQYVSSLSVPVGTVQTGNLDSLREEDGNVLKVAEATSGGFESDFFNLLPNEDHSAQWSATACGLFPYSHSECVDDPPSSPDGNTTIIAATANGQQDAFGLTDLPVLPSGTVIQWVSIHYVIRQNATPGPAYTWRLYKVWSTEFCFTDSDPDGPDTQAFFEHYTAHITTCDGPLTRDVVNNLSISFRRDSGSAAITITSAYLHVHYFTPTHTIRVYGNVSVGDFPLVRAEWNCTKVNMTLVRISAVQQDASERTLIGILPGMCTGTRSSAALQASDLWNGEVRLLVWAPLEQGLPDGYASIDRLVVVVRNTIIENATNYALLIGFAFFVTLMLVGALALKRRREGLG